MSRRQLIEVREFEKLYCKDRYENRLGCHCIGADSFKRLKSLITEFPACESYEVHACDFMKIGYDKVAGDFIIFSKYVGLIQISSGFQIQILPKIDLADGDKVREKDIFLRMLGSLREFQSKVFTAANLQTEEISLYEVFIGMYLSKVEVLLKRGLRSAYTVIEDNKHFYKGKLIVNQHIKMNITHGERFYVQYDEYNVNRAENKLIKATLAKLLRVSNSCQNQKLIRRLLNSFEMVEVSKNYLRDFASVVLDRNIQDYNMLMQWSRVFLLNKSFVTFSGDTDALSLLFPMDKLFESYLAKELRNACVGEEWDISCQDHTYYLFEEPKKKFAMRPDIVITVENGFKVILDTKWKNLQPDETNYGISQSDMYQMYAYSKKYDAPSIFLLYPQNRKMRNYEQEHGPIEFSSEDNVRVRAFFVDLANINSSVSALKDIIKKLQPATKKERIIYK